MLPFHEIAFDNVCGQNDVKIFFLVFAKAFDLS